MKYKTIKMLVKWRKKLREKNVKTFPKNAITLVREITRKQPINWHAVEELRRQYCVKDLFIVHGAAVEINGMGIIISGPPGIGKSTTLRRFVKNNKARPIDDSFVIVGIGENKRAKIIETGFYQRDKRVSMIAKRIRTIIPTKSAFTSQNWNEKRNRIGNTIGRTARLIDYLFPKDLSKTTATPKAIDLEKIILISHEKNPYLPKMIEGTRIKTITDQEFLSALKEKKIVLDARQKNLKKCIEAELQK